LAQTSPDTESYLIGLLNNAYGVAVIRDFFNGSGIGAQPNGLYNLISSNVNTTGGAPTRETITNLKSLIVAENATEVSRAYVSDTELAHKMENVKVDDGSGIFLYDGGDTLRGFNYQQTTIMPTLFDESSNTTHPLIFGDFSQAIVGYFSNISIIVDPYTLAASSQVRIIVEGFDDVALTNEKAFAINKVLTV
jgi:HK97 family phage major capsid protein